MRQFPPDTKLPSPKDLICFEDACEMNLLLKLDENNFDFALTAS